MHINVLSAIMCDLVRIENSGKHILIGVYTGDILFPKFPTRFNPTLWIEIKTGIQRSNLDFEIKIEAPGLPKPIKTEGTLEIEDQENALIWLTFPGVPINIPGSLNVSMRRKGARWQRIISKEVSQLPSS